MTINVELLKTTLAYIEAYPQDWNQSWYRCGSGMCFAGWAAQLAGGKWASDHPDSAVGDFLVAEPDDPPTHVQDVRGDVKAVDVAARASRLLGLDQDQAAELFEAHNTLDDLRTIVSELCEGAA